MSDFGIKVQAAINSLDDGIANVVLRAILFICLGIAFAAGFAWTQFRGLDNSESMEYAQLAHNIADGHGFVTHCIRPVDFRQLEIGTESKTEITALPELRKAPIYPFLLAIGFKLQNPSFVMPEAGKIFEPESKVILPLGIIFLLLTGLLVFFIALKLFDQQVAIISMILTLVNGTLLIHSISGTPMPIAIFLLSAIVLIVLHAVSAMDAKKSWRLWLGLIALAGFLCGIAFLTLYSLIVLLPMMLIWLWFAFDQKKLAATGIFVLIFALCIAPWLIRNQTVAGTPFGLAPSQIVHNTYMFAGDSYDRTLAPELSNSITTMAIKQKFNATLSQVFNKNMGLGGLGLIGAFFLVSLINRSEEHEKNLLKWIVLAGLFFTIAIIGLCGVECLRLTAIFFPLMIIFGTAFFCEFVARLMNYVEDYEAAPGVVLVLIATLPALLTILSTRGAIPYPPYYPPLVSYVTDMLDDDEMLCTDIPWATAWYGGQTSVLLPAKVSDLDDMNNFGWKCSGIYLADKAAAGSYGKDASWQILRRKEVPEGFLLTEGINLPPGRNDQLFLTDRVRW